MRWRVTMHLGELFAEPLRELARSARRAGIGPNLLHSVRKAVGYDVWYDLEALVRATSLHFVAAWTSNASVAARIGPRVC